jgi:hypothetical protein
MKKLAVILFATAIAWIFWGLVILATVKAMMWAWEVIGG